MVEIWMKNHFVGDNNLNIVNLEHLNFITRNEGKCKGLNLGW